MSVIFGLVVLVLAATLVGLVWLIRRRSEERERAEAARAAAFVAGLGPAAKTAPTTAAPPAAPAAAPAAASMPPMVPMAPTSDIALQKLLFEAAHKAGEAGEPALAIQLYARLLARFPATGFAAPARDAVAALKKKLVKG